MKLRFHSPPVPSTSLRAGLARIISPPERTLLAKTIYRAGSVWAGVYSLHVISFKGIHESQSEIAFRFHYHLDVIKSDNPVDNYFFRRDEAATEEKEVPNKASVPPVSYRDAQKIQGLPDLTFLCRLPKQSYTCRQSGR